MGALECFYTIVNCAIKGMINFELHNTTLSVTLKVIFEQVDRQLLVRVILSPCANPV